jgi:hypothetical protein
MGEKNVDRIIEAWRAEARAAGESAPGAPQEPQEPHGPHGRVGRMLRRVGRVRILAAFAALAVFTVVAVAVLAGTQEVRPTAEPAIDSGEPSPVLSPSRSSAPQSPAPQSPGPKSRQTQPLVDGWFSVVQQIDAVRSQAYTRADPALLAEAFEAGSPALASEQAAVKALADAGIHAEGWGTELLAVSQTERTGERVELRVTDQRGGYDLVAADGTRTTVPAASRSEWLVELVAKSGTWVVSQVEPVPAEGVTSPSVPPG